MELVDLASADSARTEASADVCIVGAGAAGLYLAHRLAFAGLSVAVLEAGDKNCVDCTTIGIRSVSSGSDYGGVTRGRAFGLGGTTSRWGGQLAPYSELDVRSTADPILAAWSHIAQISKKYAPQVYSVLGIQPGDAVNPVLRYLGDVAEKLEGNGITVQIAEWLPFRRRNLTHLLQQTRHAPGAVRVFIHATAASWKVLPAGSVGRVAVVTARAPNQRDVTVRAPWFVLAAGTIESTRILLELEESAGAGNLRLSPALGKCLSDHLSCRVAEVSAQDWAQTATLFGARFQGDQMRTFRFLERNLNGGVPRGFFHFVFERTDPGFAIARKLLQGVQSRQFPSFSLTELSEGITGMSALAYSRLVRSRLYIPKMTPVHLRLDIEQSPDEENAISLSTELDAMGRPMASVRWTVKQADKVNAREAALRFVRKWSEAFPGNLCLSVDDHSWSEGKLEDTYHPVGTCRLGDDAMAVVSNDLNVCGFSNLFILSTAVFPSAGTANPTFSLLCFGEDLARRITRKFSSLLT
jgi:choline dehydrogenase-like flavoprotein